MSTTIRAIAWTTFTLLVLAYGCEAVLEATRPPPTASLSASEPWPHNAPDTFLKDCLVAIRHVYGSYLRYQDWMFFRVEERTFQVLQDES